MMRLLSVELTRLRWRRAIVVLLVACIAVPLIMLAGFAWSTRPFSEADIAEAKQLAAQEAQQPYIAEEIARCEQDPENYTGPGATAADCAEALTPTYQNYLYRQEFTLTSLRTDVGAAAIIIMTGLMMLVGTTFVGHDWNTGSMSNQLLFEPRRLRVWWAKGLAVMLVGAVVGAAVLATFWAGASLVAASRDVRVEPGLWSTIVETQARGVVAIALGGLLGLALTMLFRSTVATLSLMFGISIAGSLLIMTVLGEEGTRWLLPTNFLAFVLGGFTYYDGSACSFSPDGMTSGDCERHVSAMDGGVVLAVIVVVAVLLSVWSMRRRDVP